MLNANRVWPPGLYGLYKRVRFIMRIKVKSAFFDSLMTFAVLCNTCTLAMAHYGMSESMKSMLN